MSINIKSQRALHADKKELLNKVSCIDAADALGLAIKMKSGTVYIECPYHENVLGKKDRHIGNCKISRDGKRCHCFACNGDGNAISMVMAAANLSFSDATDWLAERKAPELISKDWYCQSDTSHKKCPYSKNDFKKIGLHEGGDILVPVNISASKYEAKKTVNDMKYSIVYPEQIGNRCPTEKENFVIQCKRERVSLADLYITDIDAFFALVIPKAIEARTKYIHIMDVVEGFADGELKNLCKEEIMANIKIANKFIRER